MKKITFLLLCCISLNIYSSFGDDGGGGGAGGGGGGGSGTENSVEKQRNEIRKLLKSSLSNAALIEMFDAFEDEYRNFFLSECSEPQLAALKKFYPDLVAREKSRRGDVIAQKQAAAKKQAQIVKLKNQHDATLYLRDLNNTDGIKKHLLAGKKKKQAALAALPYALAEAKKTVDTYIKVCEDNFFNVHNPNKSFTIVEKNRPTIFVTGRERFIIHMISKFRFQFSTSYGQKKLAAFIKKIADSSERESINKMIKIVEEKNDDKLKRFIQAAIQGLDLGNSYYVDLV